MEPEKNCTDPGKTGQGSGVRSLRPPQGSSAVGDQVPAPLPELLHVDVVVLMSCIERFFDWTGASGT